MLLAESPSKSLLYNNICVRIAGGQPHETIPQTATVDDSRATGCGRHGYRLQGLLTTPSGVMLPVVFGKKIATEIAVYIPPDRMNVVSHILGVVVLNK